jgi:hypothetical protein
MTKNLPRRFNLCFLNGPRAISSFGERMRFQLLDPVAGVIPDQNIAYSLFFDPAELSTGAPGANPSLWFMAF